MIKCGERLYAVGAQFIYEPIIEIQALRVRRSRALREDSGPRDGEAIGLDPQRLHQLHVLFVTMIVIVGYVASRVIHDLAGSVREGVPDGRATPVFINRALDLIRGCGRSPEKTLREFTPPQALPRPRLCAMRWWWCCCMRVESKRRGRRREERRRARDFGKGTSGYFSAHKEILSQSVSSRTL